MCILGGIKSTENIYFLQISMDLSQQKIDFFFLSPITSNLAGPQPKWGPVARLGPRRSVEGSSSWQLSGRLVLQYSLVGCFWFTSPM